MKARRHGGFPMRYMVLFVYLLMTVLYIGGCGSEDEEGPEESTGNQSFERENEEQDDDDDEEEENEDSEEEEASPNSDLQVVVNEHKLVCVDSDNVVRFEYELIEGPVACTHPSRQPSDQCNCELRETKGNTIRVIAYSNSGTRSLHCSNRFEEIKSGEEAHVVVGLKTYSSHVGLVCKHPEEEAQPAESIEPAE